MTAASLRAEADRRVDDAIREGLDQLANGWRPREVLAVLKDAAAIVADLREQARVEEMRDSLWGTACQQPSPYHHEARCFLSGGHPGHHLYTVKAGWAA